MIQGLGERLIYQREQLNLSQEEVAKAIGVSRGVYSNYELNNRIPSVHTLMLLAGIFRCSTDYLLGLDKKPNNSIDVSKLNAKQILHLQGLIDEM